MARVLGCLLGVAMLGYVANFEGGANAEGAIAVGTTGDVVKHGIAFGLVANEPKDTAAALALSRCKAFVKGSSPEATERCAVVATFSRRCFAVALDPKSGTAGAGWGLGKNQDEANRNATKLCEKTAGPRAAFCNVETGACDTSTEGDFLTEFERPVMTAAPRSGQHNLLFAALAFAVGVGLLFFRRSILAFLTSTFMRSPPPPSVDATKPTKRKRKKAGSR